MANFKHDQDPDSIIAAARDYLHAHDILVRSLREEDEERTGRLITTSRPVRDLVCDLIIHPRLDARNAGTKHS